MVDYKGSVELTKGDLNTPDWQQAIFKGKRDKVDAIVSGYCIHHLPHERKFDLYAEIYERLSENGMFINLEHVSSSSPWGEKLNDESFVDAIYAHERKTGGGRTRAQVSEDYQNRADKRDNILLSSETQTNWLKQIGFKRVDVYFKSYELAVFAGTKL